MGNWGGGQGDCTVGTTLMRFETVGTSRVVDPRKSFETDS